MEASRSVALITGASSGIGHDLAHVFAEHGHDLILVARNVPALDQLAQHLGARHHVAAIVLPMDLADPAAPQTLYDAVQARNLSVDILVNNAGFGEAGLFTNTSLGRELGMIQLNIGALTALTKLFLPAMMQRGSGHILNVASTAAFQPGPGMAVYYATKAYVLSFSQAIADELRNTGVTVTTLCPGPTRTRFSETAGMQKSKLFSQRMVMDSRSVAEFGYRAMRRGTRVAIPGFLNRLGAFGARFAPRRLVIAISRRLQNST